MWRLRPSARSHLFQERRRKECADIRNQIAATFGGQTGAVSVSVDTPTMLFLRYGDRYDGLRRATAASTL